ncbi:MAG: HPP family protein [Firmicutes bacterium]|jgi:CBS domain-containing membrane protein|uniref:HPP family protein n=1 Tax=Sulfobacillus benefaciens TaxID=453960 RepID=A0A2T2WT38_9FIRM|nr:HPP family protein [Bacillota bacterium]MCL5012483.1 HPP family protein [Bacillota bacterium]PSR25362.1 MAG: HPP family protein [Sulfobacillus benefaciens]HBQ96319.1 HPP family protein [Sulfobacillus sp.]
MRQTFLRRYPVRLPWQTYIWFSVILVLFGLVDHFFLHVTAFLVPPYGATLTLIVALPQQSVSQPAPIIGGGFLSASIGTLLALEGHGPLMAALAGIVAFAALPPLGLFFPPGVALAIFPVLVKTTPWFPLLSVLPFTVVACGSAALLSGRVKGWPLYPRNTQPSPRGNFMPLSKE